MFLVRKIFNLPCATSMGHFCKVRNHTLFSGPSAFMGYGAVQVAPFFPFLQIYNDGSQEVMTQMEVIPLGHSFLINEQT